MWLWRISSLHYGLIQAFGGKLNANYILRNVFNIQPCYKHCGVNFAAAILKAAIDRYVDDCVRFFLCCVVFALVLVSALIFRFVHPDNSIPVNIYRRAQNGSPRTARRAVTGEQTKSVATQTCRPS